MSTEQGSKTQQRIKEKIDRALGLNTPFKREGDGYEFREQRLDIVYSYFGHDIIIHIQPQDSETSSLPKQIKALRNKVDEALGHLERADIEG